MISGSRHHVAARMTMAGERPGDVDEVHKPAAKQISQGIGVVGQHNFYHL